MPFPRAPFPRPVRAVVFDMDGLLIDTEKPVRAATLAAADAIGRPMDMDFYATVIGTPWPETFQRLKVFFGGEERLRDFRTAFEAAIAPMIRELRLMEGVLEILDHLDRSGLPMAVCTSTGREKALLHLEKAGILHRFRHVVTRDDVTRGKPDPEPYLTAAARLEVDAADCLALEDSHNGIRAAHGAGMMAVMVPDLLPATDEIKALCHHVADDLHAVRALLQRAGH